MAVDDVPDSTDWLATPLACLAAVEASMRCQVCKDFYKTPMITTCSHTFCSLCIRRALSNDGKCPLCRAPEQELKLRSNWALEESVEAFSTARQAALDVARSELQTVQPKKRKSDNGRTTDSAVSPTSKRVRMSTRLASNGTRSASHMSPERGFGRVIIPASDEDEGSNNDDDGDSDYSPANADSFVPCPSCEMKMKAWQVFQHLEACSGPTPESMTSETLSTGRELEAKQLRQKTTPDRLPALNYSMLKEPALRKKLAELGIPNQGPRLTLEKRHKEWITIWNANCDSAQPRKRSQLLQDLDVWERTQGHRAIAATKGTISAVTIKDKNFDGAAWAAKHDSSFKDLIANARNSRLRAKESPRDITDDAERRISSCVTNDLHDSRTNYEGISGLTAETRQTDAAILDGASSQFDTEMSEVQTEPSPIPAMRSIAEPEP
ncbi:postreplication repair protein uvsH/nuvA [Pochonia chlamydosporia 170]|uniref:Postreplication repair E3 ubiquitin-protein ligase RAD18 n=1 Tax=Pochonia chlamydosporia 170 TaxID=1380566 RepID=A0A179FAC6_METCM|nr:postreplication repair protein uvsH/nuvA [Pochonia chlamydosporia 170]OAQ62241.1 postreplication repair protein uvsH/nuvA [Pochonia chlamydosporia 170]